MDGPPYITKFNLRSKARLVAPVQVSVCEDQHCIAYPYDRDPVPLPGAW